MSAFYRNDCAESLNSGFRTLVLDGQRTHGQDTGAASNRSRRGAEGRHARVASLPRDRAKEEVTWRPSHPEQTKSPSASRAALDAADLAMFRDLLHPDAQWGPPDDPVSGCHNRDQVLAWYARASNSGLRAHVTEAVVGDNKLLVGLKVIGTDAAEDHGGQADRWQVLTLKDDLVIDIRGFDDRAEASTFGGIGR